MSKPAVPETSVLQMRADVATAIASGDPAEAVLERLLRLLSDELPANRFMLLSVDDYDTTRLRASTMDPDLTHRINRTPRSKWYGSWAAALNTRRPVEIPVISQSALYREHGAELEEAGFSNSISIPFSYGLEGSIGVLSFYGRDDTTLGEHQRALAAEGSKLAALALGAEYRLAKIRERLNHDPLTGLDNRNTLEPRLVKKLAAIAPDEQVCLLFIDIDDLTLINDSLGHTYGDRVISTVSERIRTNLLPGDLVVRFGGDEFIVVIDHVANEAQAIRIVDHLRELIAQPITLRRQELVPSVSIGVSFGSAENDALALIDQGHAAVVRAKQSGKGSTAVHDTSLDNNAKDRLDREVRLREAIERQELCLRWQPEISVANGKIVGAEALVRWDQPENGLTSPDAFIGTAERSGLINALTDQVLKLAFEERARIAAALPAHADDFSISINLSANQLLRPTLVERIADSIERGDIASDVLIIELTETTLADARVAERLIQLRDLGVRTAIDDFGTGYSSLAYIHTLPVDLVKVDKAFVEDLDASGHGAPLLAAAVAMARGLGLMTIAEGIESEQQLLGLRELHVDWAQGYLISEPLTAEELTTLIKDQR